MAVEACGVCGTDLHLFEGIDLPRGATYPVRPGHEVAGVVIESAGGPFAAGDQVVLHPLLPCGSCPACRSGHENRCRSAAALGIDLPGGLADEVIWPASRLVPAPRLPSEVAAILCDAVASAHHALEVAGVPAAGALTVFGAGGVGANILQLARVLDEKVTLTAVVRSEATARRIEALGLGIKVLMNVEGSARKVLDASGPQDAVIEFGPGVSIAGEALMMLARGGRFVLGSISSERLDLPTTVTAVVTRELEIRGTYASTIDDLRAVVGLALGNRLDLAGLISHRLSLAEASNAFNLLRERPAGLARIVVSP